jgi:hypothetical protein
MECSCPYTSWLVAPLQVVHRRAAVAQKVAKQLRNFREIPLPVVQLVDRTADGVLRRGTKYFKDTSRFLLYASLTIHETGAHSCLEHRSKHSTHMCSRADRASVRPALSCRRCLFAERINVFTFAPICHIYRS